ncbi:MAG TPA: tetratricopeptide repeat protein [Thermodesulfobacteriota bacterium]
MRTLLVRLDSRPRRAAALVLLLGLLAVVGARVIRQAAASVIAALASGPADLERAIALDPGNPDLRLRAADMYANAFGEADVSRARAHLEAALLERPTHGAAWLRLAAVEDHLGRAEAAEAALGRALAYDPHSVSLRWEAALLALRRGDSPLALENFRYVLTYDPSRRDAAFQLARSLLAPDEPVSSLFPDDADVLRAILEMAVRDGDVDLSKAVWERRVAMNPPLAPELQRRFLDLLLEQGEGRTARRLWAAMAPVTGRPEASDLVWNGGFEQGQLLGWGFDWQVRRVWGVEVRIDGSQAASGRQSLRLAFNAFPTLDFDGVSQLVPVEEGRSYRLSALVRAQDFVTRSGLKLQVLAHDRDEVLGETAPVSGTTEGWVPLDAEVEVPPDVTLVRIRLRRERAPGPEGNLGGKVWVDDVSLTPLAG